MQLEVERGADQVLGYIEQLLGQRDKLADRQATMALVHGLREGIGNSSADPDHGGLLDPELHRDGVGGLEANAADVARKPVRVLGHDLDGVAAVGLEDAHRARGANPMAMQEHHDFPHGLLFGPGGKNAGGAHRADAFDLPQPVGARLDDVEDLLAERPHEFLGIDRAYAPDHPG